MRYRPLIGAIAFLLLAIVGSALWQLLPPARMARRPPAVRDTEKLALRAGLDAMRAGNLAAARKE
ncbi:MAG: hypothetical protein JWM11_7811, partial [Planctomycetaceae bacterium]|nr:hypothetical protein [Planctomycetaceae bacterium]